MLAATLHLMASGTNRNLGNVIAAEGERTNAMAVSTASATRKFHYQLTGARFRVVKRSGWLGNEVRILIVSR